MKKKISILGSTGSIGETTLKIIYKKNKMFQLNTLIANSNYKKICKQIIKNKPKNFVINDKKTFLQIKKKFKGKKINLYSDFKYLPKSSTVNDITVVGIPGLAGLEPTIKFVQYSKKLLLANKESIICGWLLLNKLSKKYKTEIIPIDSEHFSINKLSKDYKDKDIEKIYITASGGPFLNLPINKFKSIKPHEAIKHPRWSMGKKISVDSSTLMNKILELLEAIKIFSFNPKKYEIIIHPQSLVHAIIKFKNGITEFLYHIPDMTIPISNAIFDYSLNIREFVDSKKNSNQIENLQFFKTDSKRFPVLKLIPKLNQYLSTSIIINASNEILIDHFLKKKISYNSISKYLFKVLKDKNYKKYAIKTPSNIKIIYNIDQWARRTTINIINSDA